MQDEGGPAASKDTPMTAGNRSTPLNKLVSPADEERAMVDCSPPTACRKGSNEGSPHGEKVLEVVYRPIGASPFASSSEQDDAGARHTLPQKRRFCMDSAPPKRKRSAWQSVEWVDALTSNAVDSPLCDLGERRTERSIVLRKTLADLVQETRLVTKSDFFSHETYTPFPVIDFAVSEAMIISHGPIGSDENLRWFQSSGGANHEFCLEYTITTTQEESANSSWNSKEGPYLRWTAHVLDWIQNYGRDNGRRIESFPQPLQKGASSNADSYALRLGFTHSDKPAFEYEILGTLEDLMHLHHAYNNGPIPETVVAWLVLRVLQCVSTLHQCGVTHNDMGLDSFLLVRRKHSPSENGENNEWFLVCVDLGSAAIIATEDVLNEMSQSDQGWHFKHDLYSVANIANLLLAGGVPLHGQRIGDGSIDLPWKRFIFQNIYLRGQIAWNDLFQALLNLTNSACGMHLVNFDTFVVPQDGTTWPQRITDACRLVESVSNMGGAELGVLNRLMEHMHQVRTDGQWKIPANDRFPVKLADNAVDDAQQNKEQGQTAALDPLLSAALEERRKSVSLLTDKEKELQRVKDDCEAKLLAAKSTYQQQLEQQQTQADARLQEAEATFTQTLKKLKHDRAVEKEATRKEFLCASEMSRRQMENVVLMAASREQGLLAALAQRNSELENMKRFLSEQQQQQVSVRDCESIATLQVVNGAIGGLRAMEKQVNEIQKEKDELQNQYERLRNEKDEDASKNKEQEKQLRAALEESKKRFDVKLAEKDETVERARRAEAQLNSSNMLVIVLEQRLETAEEKISEAERIRIEALHELRRDHAEALTLLKEQHEVETETQRAELEGLERKFSDQAKELTQVEARSTELRDKLTSVKAAVKEQSQLFVQTVQHLKDEVLETEMTGKDAALKRTLRDREQALARQGSLIESQSRAFELHKSQQDEGLRRRECDLKRRMEEFEAEMHCRQAEWDQKTQVLPVREASAPQRRSSLDGVKRKSPPASQESAASGKSRGSRRRGQKSAFSLIIPGQSLSMAGLVQKISQKHGASRVVIDEPSDSDDSEAEL
jgi:serine/threonine protein kinase